MSVVAIVQARMTSTRLPGKVLLPLARGTVLSTLIGRLFQARLVDQIVVATSVDSTDDAVAEAAAVAGVFVYRGSLLDVLHRFVGAVRRSDANLVVRITADCPLVDPDLIDTMIERFWVLLDRGDGCDYLSNTLTRSFPRGLDIEIFTRSALEQAEENANLPFQREHVTPYIYDRSSGFHLENFSSVNDLSHHRWTLDTSEDYEFLRAIFDRLGETWSAARMPDILSLLSTYPELSLLNSHVQQKTLDN